MKIGLDVNLGSVWCECMFTVKCERALFSMCFCHGGCLEEVAGEWVRCADRSRWTLRAQLLWLFLAWLLPQVPGGSALLVHREINTLQTSCLVGCGSLGWPPGACSCHGNQSRSASVCHRLWARAAVGQSHCGEGWPEGREEEEGPGGPSEPVSSHTLLGPLFCLQT